MKHEPFVIERTYDAPVAAVWKAITDKEEMRKWYFDVAEFRPEPGFTFRFYGKGAEGEDMLHICQVKEVIVERKLSYSWRYEGYEGSSLVTFELFPEDGGTRIRLIHEGLETFPPLPGFAKTNFVTGWTALIGDLLKNFVEQQ